MLRFGSTIDGGVGTAVMEIDWEAGEKASMKARVVGGVVAVAAVVTVVVGWE